MLRAYQEFSAQHLDKARNTLLCYNCKNPGHKARECILPRSCFICSEQGHVARRCPHVDVLHRRFRSEEDFNQAKGTERVCLNCHEQGHRAKLCPQRRSCFMCGSLSHLAAQCPSTATIRVPVGPLPLYPGTEQPFFPWFCYPFYTYDSQGNQVVVYLTPVSSLSSEGVPIRESGLEMGGKSRFSTKG